ncbi:hypothetical protein ACJX0J_041369, partial [Zea mays]
TGNNKASNWKTMYAWTGADRLLLLIKVKRHFLNSYQDKAQETSFNLMGVGVNLDVHKYVTIAAQIQ